MTDHSVTVASTKGGALTYSDNFNVAVPFIDRHVAEGRADKTIITSVDGETVTYGELAERVNRCGNALRDLGIGKGERLLMMVKDCPEFFYVFWGAIKAGIVPVPLNTLLVAKDYEFMIENSACAAVVYSPEFASHVEPALAASPHKPAHIILTEGTGNRGGDSIKSLLAAAAADLDPAPATAESECFWLYSSGSTGKPKGTVHVHRDMVVTSQYYGVDTLDMTQDDVCFSAAKLFFAYGLGNAMTFPLWVGARAVLLAGRPAPDNTLEIITKFKPTLYFGVPTLYAAQLQYLEDHEADFSSVRHCVSAGEALPAEVFRRWKEKTGQIILDGIGSTEALHIFLSNFPDDVAPGTTGRAVPGYDTKILGEDGAPVAQGEPGILYIRGPSSAPYYWRNEEKTRNTMVDGWLNTGDTYLQNEDDRFVCCGRSDDMLKVGGIWCSPVEIEAKLVEHAKVLEAAVVGRPDKDELIKPEAWIVLKDPGAGHDGLEDELLRLCKEGMAKYKYPRWINFVDDLPKTATGKIQRFKLRQ